MTDVSDYNFFVGFADNAFVDPATVPTDCIGFSHLEATTSIQFLSRKNSSGVTFDMLEAKSRRYHQNKQKKSQLRLHRPP